MKILYLHGYNSRFDPTTDKMKELSVLGEVVGISIDYNKTKTVIENALSDMPNDIDILVGTSMGGWLSNKLGTLTDLPYVSINPAINPNHLLELKLPEFDINNNFGIVLLDENDEMINSNYTASMINGKIKYHMFEGGNHRFTHMANAISIIQRFYTTTYYSSGVSNV